MVMPFRVHERVYLGDQTECRSFQCYSAAATPIQSHVHREFAVIHACKWPCHTRAVGSKQLDSSHPHYLALEDGEHQYLNLIDPPTPLFKIESFNLFLRFADKQYGAGRTLLIHCNKGRSRAPSLALVFLAKRLRTIDSRSFDGARADFERVFSAYEPGSGIVTFLQTNWSAIG